ncbi:MAG: glycyl-radical enzyme activating protein [Bacillota bacterium]|nr:glycyl-radical enzyme activating protein [Bacillota bacterium]
MSSTAERVLVGSIQKFSVEDGPGIRTTVFLKGCPLSCRWCHNPEMIEGQQQLIRSPNNCIGCGYCVDICPQAAVTIDPQDGIVIDRTRCDVCLKCAETCYAKALRAVAKPMTVDEIIGVVEQDKGFYDNTGGGMTVSGGEILMHADFVGRLIDEAGKRGISTCLDTSGCGDPDELMGLACKENVTYILYDMKSIDDEVHREYTGVSNRLILDNLRMLAADSRTRDKLIMRMPLVKGVNDSDDIIRRTGELYRQLGIRRVDLLPYHSLGISKKRNVGGVQEEFEAPSEERITEIEIYFKDEINLSVGILGRV